jgi:hypothetical protein
LCSWRRLSRRAIPPAVDCQWLSDLFQSGVISRGNITTSASSGTDNLKDNILIQPGRSPENHYFRAFQGHSGPSWVELQFPSSVAVTEYGFRHPSSYGGDYFLRNWDFEGFDGQKWQTLRRHRSDQTVSKSSTFYSWKIEPTDRKFDRVRIVMTGANSFGNHNLVMADLDVRL